MIYIVRSISIVVYVEEVRTVDAPGMISHQLVAFSAQAQWRGSISLGATRRVSDFLNDVSQNYIPLDNATLTIWNNGVPENTVFETVAVNKHIIIAVGCDSDTVHMKTTSPDRVVKLPQRVTVYAPPFVLEGNIHIARNIQLIEMLNNLHTEFIAMTRTALWWLDKRAPIAMPMNFVAINRQWISALHSLDQHEIIAEPSTLSARMQAASL